MKKPVRVLATGISGANEKEYQERHRVFCESFSDESLRKKVKSFNVGDLMYAYADMVGRNLSGVKNNILHVYPEERLAWRSVVLKGILDELSICKNLDAAIVNVHGWLINKEIAQIAIDPYLRKYSADMYIVFIDNYERILERLRLRSQWQDENLTEEKILKWQNHEVELTMFLAQFMEKPFFAVPTAQPASTLFKLLFHPEIEPVYAAMPISFFKAPEQQDRIDKFFGRISPYFTVFDPRTVEAVGAMSADDFKNETKMTIANHIVHRDMTWLVQQSKKIIAYWPEDAYSSGMDHEIHHAYIRGMDVWVIYLGSKTSPFVPFFSTRIFRSEDDFVEFLEKKYPERKNLVW